MTQLEDNQQNRVVGNLLADARREPKGDGYQWNFDELVGRIRGEYHFLDYVFDNGNFSGATGSSMVPVSQEEYDRRLEEYKDYEYSPIAHLYDEENTPLSWDEWISKWDYDLPDLVLDDSYVHKYGDIVIEKAESESDMETSQWWVECIGGGRMFRPESFEDYDKVYNPDLLTLIETVETRGLSEFF